VASSGVVGAILIDLFCRSHGWRWGRLAGRTFAASPHGHGDKADRATDDRGPTSTQVHGILVADDVRRAIAVLQNGNIGADGAAYDRRIPRRLEDLLGLDLPTVGTGARQDDVQTGTIAPIGDTTRGTGGDLRPVHHAGVNVSCPLREELDRDPPQLAGVRKGVVGYDEADHTRGDGHGDCGRCDSHLPSLAQARGLSRVTAWVRLARVTSLMLDELRAASTSPPGMAGEPNACMLSADSADSAAVMGPMVPRSRGVA